MCLELGFKQSSLVQLMDVRLLSAEETKALAPPLTEFGREDRLKSRGHGVGCRDGEGLTITGEPGDGGL